MFEQAAVTIDDTTELADSIRMSNLRQLNNNRDRAQTTLLFAQQN